MTGRVLTTYGHPWRSAKSCCAVYVHGLSLAPLKGLVYRLHRVRKAHPKVERVKVPAQKRKVCLLPLSFFLSGVLLFVRCRSLCPVSFCLTTSFLVAFPNKIAYALHSRPNFQQRIFQVSIAWKAVECRLPPPPLSSNLSSSLHSPKKGGDRKLHKEDQRREHPSSASTAMRHDPTAPLLRNNAPLFCNLKPLPKAGDNDRSLEPDG